MMNSQEYRNAIAALDLSQVRAAHLLGVDARTSRRWATGERPVPDTVVRFLRLVMALRMTGEDAIALLG